MTTRDELTEQIRSGAIDTVIMAFPDTTGRLTGKRTTGRFFLDHVADHGTENCDYLIACDVDDNPLPGYTFASYDQGYGDMVARPDWSSVRVLPWMQATALVMCDLFRVGQRGADGERATTGAPIAEAPRTILARQVEAAATMGMVPMVASEIEFVLFTQSYAQAHAQGYRRLTPHSPWL
ncbi:MAG TPA: hypothetical protein PLV68_11055, partial [Ilumatobacteraceae bacterium]|nr:hypothetical protein [Ilumatobacteraceae bacterium]